MVLILSLLKIMQMGSGKKYESKNNGTMYYDAVVNTTFFNKCN